MSTFNTPTDVSVGALARSSHINLLDAACVEAFGLLPTNAALNANTLTYAVDTGAANAYLVALPKTAVAYTDGMIVVFKPSAPNTGASTIDVDSIGAKAIRQMDSTALSAGVLLVGVPALIMYSSTTGFFHLLFSATHTPTTQYFDVVATYAALSTQSVDGFGRIDAATGNFYTWDTGGAKWRVMPGNRYTTAQLADPIVAANHTIETGMVVFDTTVNIEKRWSGSAWIGIGGDPLQSEAFIY